MRKLFSTWLDLRTLDELAYGPTNLHRLHPVVKIVVTLFFAAAVTSFHKYEIAGLLPLFFYPVILFAWGNIPYQPLIRRLLLAAPFALVIGLSNLAFDRTPHVLFQTLIVTGGWFAFCSLLLKFVLTVLAALLLIATTPWPALVSGLRRLGLPRPLVVQLFFLYRYLTVLLEEAGRVTQAYELRSRPGAGLPYRAWGSLVGQLLLKTLDRAQRIYAAMRCRGFNGELPLLHIQAFHLRDWLYLLFWCSFFGLCRLYNLPQVLGKALLEVL